MRFSLRCFLLPSLLLCTVLCQAQVGVTHLNMKGFSGFGFGGTLKFSFPVADANYVTFKGGFDYYIDSYAEEVGLLPVLLGYCYSVDQSGAGLYVEPNLGYAFGSTTIQDENFVNEKVAGPMAGTEVGYIFEPQRWISFSLSLEYEHSFGQNGANMLTLSFTHAFVIGRRSSYY